MQLIIKTIVVDANYEDIVEERNSITVTDVMQTLKFPVVIYEYKTNGVNRII